MSRSVFFLSVAALMAMSCSKGYRVRVANYYYERFDSVIVGDRAVIFTDVSQETVTDYQKITSGKHAVLFVTQGGERFYRIAPLEKGGSGDHTIQIDGLRSVSVLQD